MPDTPQLGLCCACSIKRATAIVMLPRRGPVPGKGWGCLQCGLPPDGAVAVLCDTCEPEALRFVCNGYASERSVVAITTLSDEVFEHDLTKHPEQQP